MIKLNQDKIDQIIFNNEPNPYDFEEDEENNKGWFYVYFQPIKKIELDVILPFNWFKWMTIKFTDIWTLTQYYGNLDDRNIAKNLLEIVLLDYKNKGKIGEFIIRKTYPSGLEL